MQATIRRWTGRRFAIGALAAMVLLAATVLLAAIPATIEAAGAHDAMGTSPSVSEASQATPDQTPAAAASESTQPPGDAGLSGWAIAGLAISFVVAALLLAGAAGYLLPKPPGR